jgi:hypothetical protein
MKLRKAFSLTELSVVVLVASAVLVGILSVQTSSNSTNKVKVTHDRIGQVYRALKVYTGSHKKLPCPASIAVAKNDPAYGNEGSCAADTVVYGMVPVKALNLAAEFAEDDYGNKLVYVVDSTFTVATTPSKFVDQEGDIVVKRYSSSLGVEESNAIFAIISRGKNQRGAVASLATVEMNAPDDVDELENMPSGSDAILISGSNRSGTTFDDLLLFKNKKYFLADADLSKLQDSNLSKLQDSNMVGCTAGYTRVGGDCVVQCDVPTTIGINSGAKVNQGTNKTLSCNAPNFKTSDSINYSCSSSKVFTNNSGACTCQTGYDLSGSSCEAITCSITGVSGFNNKSGLAYATTATAISSPCQAEYIGSPTYTCTNSGAATLSGGGCNFVTCTAAAGSGYDPQSGLLYAAAGSGSFACATGFSGNKNYTCTSTGAATITGGTCSPTICTASAGTGYGAQSSLGYAASGTGTFSCNAPGYSGTKNYTCTTTGAATITGGTCSQITCTASAGTGYGAQSGLGYAASGTGTFSCNAPGYSGTKNYTCTTTGAATITGGTCTGTFCTASAGTGYGSRSGLIYAASGSGTFSCNATGYTGTKNYTCTTTGAATITGGTCTSIKCTAAAGTGYNAQSNLPYATSGSGTFSCNASGYTGNKKYTCTATGAATSIGGTCTAITCTASAGTGYGSQSGLAYAPSSGSFSCSAGYSGNKTYTCTTTGAATITGGTCSPITCAVISITGINWGGTTTVAYGSGSKSCNGTNFNTADTINYYCSGSMFVTSGTCTCASGYMASGSTCITQPGRWTLVTSAALRSGQSRSARSSQICDSANNGKWISDAYADATVSGNTITSLFHQTSNYWLTMGDTCYSTTSASATLSCETGGGGHTTRPFGGAFKIYRCDYP